MLKRKLRVITSLSLLLAMVGCGDGRPVLKLPTRHPVQGKVSYRGQPAAGFRVVFHPTGDIGALKFAPSAVTGTDGSFKLRSYDPHDGAPPGEYAVTFEWPDHFISDTDPDPVPEVDQLRGAYSRPEQSKFKVNVVAGENVIPPFDLR